MTGSIPEYLAELPAYLRPDDSDNYESWRQRKLNDYPTDPAALIVHIENLADPSPAEITAISENCARTNMSFFKTTDEHAGDRTHTRNNLRNFAAHFGLETPEAHRSADDDGIVALEVTDAPKQAGYIPYTNMRLSWHTDGYYNYHAPNRAIRAMLMYCARPADDGGENAYLDPDIAYIRLRDENPDFVKALMNPGAMTIPENREDDGKLRPTNSGPVFFADDMGRLAMRYSARTRNIIWHDDPLTRDAVSFLNQTLEDDPLIIRYRLEDNEGVLCNNVLHNRTGFDKEAPASARLMYRARFYEAIS